MADEAAKTELWDLPDDTWDRFLVTMRRALTRRCPYCGGPDIFDGYFTLRERCPTCGVTFEREEGYFLGGYALNLVVAEIIGLGLAIVLLFKTDLRHLDLIWQELIAVALAVAFPLIFFPFSRTVWMALDLAFHPPPRSANRSSQPSKHCPGNEFRELSTGSSNSPSPDSDGPGTRAAGGGQGGEGLS